MTGRLHLNENIGKKNHTLHALPWRTRADYDDDDDDDDDNDRSIVRGVPDTRNS